MKLIHPNQAQEFILNDGCRAYEYPLGDKDINGAIIKLDGRYPQKGYALNTVCKELAYIIEGNGTLTQGSTNHELQTGDMLLLLPGEKYYFEGRMTMLMPCTPAWYPEQHQTVT